MIRQPIVSGMFYESNKEMLSSQIKSCFLNQFGPGTLPKEDKNQDETFGLISPHAGFMCSGPCAAYGFKKLAESSQPKTYIILGLSHRGYPSAVSLIDWQTPLGIARTDRELGSEIIKNTNIKQNEDIHALEHSIEVQIPFIQFISQKKEFKILPIIISEDIDLEKTAKKILESIKKLNRKTTIIASSDFTHYGENYNYFPFKKNIKENLYSFDKTAIEHIKIIDTNGFKHYIEKTKATICGKNPILLLMELSNQARKQKASLLKYYTSGEITKDYSSAVGYASIIIE